MPHSGRSRAGRGWHGLGRLARRVRAITSAGVAPALIAGGFTLPSAAMVAATAALTVAAVAAAPAISARAATPSGPSGNHKALVLLQNGETTAPETTALQAAGWTVTQATPAQWLADSASTFETYAALVIGDPSTSSSCSTLTPTTATSGTDAIGTTWQSAVTGNVAVLGTAPAAAGSSDASTFVDDAVAYAGSGSGTGLYASLNCEYSTAAAKTAVPLLNGVEGIGAAGGLTVKGSLSCTDPGTLNTWEADAAGTFPGFTSSALGIGSWQSPGCPVHEAFSSWPAIFTPVAYDSASDATANFTASDGVSGQPYALLGHPVTTATAALAPGTGGEVSPLSAVGGSNPAAPGITQATAGDPVDTESGDFTQSYADLSVPGYGPALDFSRTYDAQAARQQTVAGTPGPLGYGWTDNWATSVTVNRPVPGDIYTVNTTGVYPFEPTDMVSDAAGDVFYVDATANSVVEVAASSHTQFGIAMTAGTAYYVAGSSSGASGDSGDGGAARSALLNSPWGLTLDGSGDLFIADMGNNRVQEVPAATGTQFGISMTANDMYTVAGSATGASGSSGNAGKATSALLNTPSSVRVDHAGNVYIADSANFRVQEVPAATGTQRGQAMTAGYMYTIAGNASTSIYAGDGGPATSASFVSPSKIAIDPAGDLYISDDYENTVREIPASTGTQWGQAMTVNDIYTIAGNSAAAGSGGSSGDGGPATSAELNGASGLALDAAGDLYIGDIFNNRIQEVPVASGTQWGQSMTADDMYTIIGSSMTEGDTGDGGPATAAELNWPGAVTIDAAGNLLIPDAMDSKIREVFASTSQLFNTSPAGTGVTVNQADGSQVTFYPAGSGGTCAAPYVATASGGYCTLPQNVDATLSYSSSAGTYTYAPAPGTTYTYSASTGALMSESDSAGETLTLTANTPAPGSGNCPSTASSCQTITAASGRAIVLGSNAAKLVTSATDPLGRQWKYAYSSASQLISATDPMGNVTSYTYGAGSTGNLELANDLLTMTAPNGQPGGPTAGKSTVNVYDAQGRVTSQTDPMGNATTFTYCANAATGDCMNSATGTGIVTVTDPDGYTSVDDYTQGALTAETNWSGGVGNTLISGDDYGPNLANGTLEAAWTANGAQVGGADLVEDYSAYDSMGNPVSGTELNSTGNVAFSAQYTSLDTPECLTRESASSSASCAATPGPTPVAPGHAITPPSSAPPAGQSWSLYDTDGDLLYTVAGVYAPGASSTSTLRTSYSLYNGNTVTLNGSTISCAASAPTVTLPCATINADGVVTQLGYDSAGDLISSAAPDGNGSEVAKTTDAYDGDGEQTSEILPDGNLSGANAGNYTTVTAYNADGEKTSVSEGDGSGATVTARVTSYTYDADGNSVTDKDPGGNTTTTAYNADDQSTLITDADGDATLTCYDGDGNTAQTVPPAGVAANSLTPASCPTSYPAGYSDRLAADAIVITYDGSSDKLQVTTPAPAGQSGYETTSYAYDGNGNLIETTAPPTTPGGAAPVTVDTYTTNGEIASQTTGYGTSAAATTSYCYNPEGFKTAVIAPDGNTSGTAQCEAGYPWQVSASTYPTQAAHQTTYSYDSTGDLVSTTTPATTADPSGATTTNTYNAAGQLLTSTDPASVTTTDAYTPTGALASESYSNSAAHAVSYAYDADGRLTSSADASGTSTTTWDPFGEISTATSGAGQATSYTYNPTGTPATITYPLPSSATWATSKSVSFAYDSASRLTGVTDFTGNKVTITSNADGLITKQALGTTGDTISTAYSATDTPSAITLATSSSTLQSFTYTDAPAGNITAESDSPASPNASASYNYDPLGRVTSATYGSNGAEGYSYDQSGNLLALPGGATGTYNDAGELTSSSGSTATGYTYSASGERLTATQGSTTEATASWNGDQELTGYTDSAATMTGATYNSIGLRTSATFTPSGGSATTDTYAWAGDQLLQDSVNAYIYDGSQVPVEQVNLSTGKVTYLVTDTIGSVRGVVTGSTGALAGTTGYDTWGAPQTAAGLTATTPFGYSGGYTDPDGLIYLINRYYDPATGQFISVDPDLAETQQPYSYAAGDPVTLTDPTGQYTLGICINGSINLIIYTIGGEGCLTRTVDTPAHNDDIGFTRTAVEALHASKFATGISVSAGVNVEVSNSNTLTGLLAYFHTAQISWPLGYFSLNFSAFWGGTVVGYDAGAAFGMKSPLPIPSFDIGDSYTWVDQFNNRIEANAARAAWDVVFDSNPVGRWFNNGTHLGETTSWVKNQIIHRL